MKNPNFTRWAGQSTRLALAFLERMDHGGMLSRAWLFRSPGEGLLCGPHKCLKESTPDITKQSHVFAGADRIAGSAEIVA